MSSLLNNIVDVVKARQPSEVKTTDWQVTATFDDNYKAESAYFDVINHFDLVEASCINGKLNVYLPE